jgi:murein L,D-transpeptidase YcbB/YkuD
LILLVAITGCSRKVDNADHVAGIRALTEGTPAWVEKGRLGTRLWKIEQQFYAAREHVPAWVDGDETTAQWKDLVQQLKYSERHGLDPETYGVADFEALREASQTRMRGTRFPAERVPELDARMTYAYLRYAADLLGWTHRAKDVHPNWLEAPKEVDLAARLAAAIDGHDIRGSLEELAPTHAQYQGLQAALAADAAAPSGRATQLKMNLERWRWAARDLGERHILINVPAYQMQVVEGERPVMAMRVIVGAPDNQTPLFSDVMTYVVFSPYWNIPPGILRDETLPRLAADKDYLRRNNIEVVGTSGDDVVDPDSIDWSDEEETRGLRFRQAPGPENALGLVKFIFPNHFNVYLHDTPGHALFDKDHRALSHGCIRVERPVDLAKYVLQDKPQWTEARIEDAMQQDKEETVVLGERLPVHIGYWTAWVAPDGKTVTYTDDPYGIDAKHAKVRGETLATGRGAAAPAAQSAPRAVRPRG